MSKFKELITRDILFLLASSFLFFANNNMLLPTFPLYVAHLGGSDKLVGLLGGLYALTAVFLRPYLSKLSDDKGRKLVLFIAGFTATTGPLFYLFNFGYWYLALVRVYHAASLAAFITASQTLLADLSERESRGTVIGIYGIAGGTAMAVAPVLGIRIASTMGFQTLFKITALIGLGILPFVFMINEPQITRHNSKIKTIPVTQIIKNKWVVIPSVALFSATVAQGAINTFLPLHGLSVGIANIGIFFTIFSISSMVARVIAGILSDKLGRKTLALPALFSIGIGVLFLIQLPNYFMLIIGAILIGFGFSTTHTSLLALIIDKTTVQERSQAVSFYANAYDLGVSIGSMGLGIIAVYSYNILWMIVAGFAFIGLFLTTKMLPIEKEAINAEIEVV